MNKLVLAPQRIVFSRTVRVLLDGVVLLLAFYFLLELRALSVEQNLLQKEKINIQKLSTQNKLNNKKIQVHEALFIEERHTTEAAMWQTWQAWLTSTQPASGHCVFDTQPESTGHPFYILCFGNSAGNRPPNLPEADMWFPKNLFVAPNVHLVTAPEKSEAKKQAPTYKVEGWMNTSQGQKKFHPEQQKWLP